MITADKITPATQSVPAWLAIVILAFFIVAILAGISVMAYLNELSRAAARKYYESKAHNNDHA